MIKQLLPLAAVVATLLLSPSVKAVTGDCDGTGAFETDVSADWPKESNVSGKEVTVANSSVGANYAIDCSCPAGSRVSLYYIVKSALTTTGHAAKYYRLNDNLDIKTQINDIPGNPAVTVPSDLSRALKGNDVLYSSATKNSVCTADPSDVRAPGFSIGKDTTITLYVTKPFLGELIIPETHIASIQGAWSNSSTYPRPVKDIANIYIQGRITVPQSCKINQGDTIHVNLGFISAQRFTTKNSMPLGYTPVRFDVTYDCGDMSAIKNNLSMRIDASDHTDEYTLVARRRESDNTPDVGVHITDVTTGYIEIPIDGGELSIDQSGVGTTNFQAYPVNLVGGTLATGPFKASATITIVVR
ncbi:fimbrial protein [Shigella flexneri]